MSVVRLSRLLELRVEDEDGRSLGHVHDVRVHRVNGAYRVEGLIVGPRGLLIRLGWHRAKDPAPLAPYDTIPWERVLAIEPDRLIVERE
jgi:sporulation protein YlmC with PRC-barrel domain